MTDHRTASQEAAARLGVGADHDDVMADAERLLERSEWSERDRLKARNLLDRAKHLGDRPDDEGDRTPADESPQTKTASELAADHLTRQGEGNRRASRGWR